MTDHILSPVSIRDYENQYFNLRKTASSGYGLFAKQPIKAGTTILREAPMIPNAFERHDERHCISNLILFRALYNALSHQDKLTYLSTIRSESMTNKYIEVLHDRTPLERILTTILLAIYETNAFGGRVYKLASRINHSCQPNVRYNNMQDGGNIRLHTLRDIVKGEELMTCYVGDYFHHERFTRLLRFDFICSCGACTLSNRATSDKRRRRIQRLAHDFQFMAERMRAQFHRVVISPTHNAYSMSGGDRTMYGPMPPSLVDKRQSFNLFPAIQEAERLLAEEDGIQDLGQTIHINAGAMASMIVKRYSVWDTNSRVATSVQPYRLPSSLPRKEFVSKAAESACRSYNQWIKSVRLLDGPSQLRNSPEMQQISHDKQYFRSFYKGSHLKTPISIEMEQEIMRRGT